MGIEFGREPTWTVSAPKRRCGSSVRARTGCGQKRESGCTKCSPDQSWTADPRFSATQKTRVCNSAKAESVSSKNSRSWGQQTGILDGVPGAVHGIWNSYCAAFRRDFERYFHLKFIVHDIATRVLKRRISIISDISVRKDSPIVITTFLNATILKPIECIF